MAPGAATGLPGASATAQRRRAGLQRLERRRWRRPGKERDIGGKTWKKQGKTQGKQGKNWEKLGRTWGKTWGKLGKWLRLQRHDTWGFTSEILDLGSDFAI